MTEAKTTRERRPAARHDCPACSAKDQTITVLADQVDWLRAQLAAAQTVRPALVPPAGATAFPPPDSSGRMWVSDEEELLAEAKAAGYLDERAYMEALAAEQVGRATIDQN